MNTLFTNRFCLFAALSAALAVAEEAKVADGAVAVESGTATFHVDTNISAISVKGKSTAVRGRAVVKQAPEGLTIEQIEASVPVNTLSSSQVTVGISTRLQRNQLNGALAPSIALQLAVKSVN